MTRPAARAMAMWDALAAQDGLLFWNSLDLLIRNRLATMVLAASHEAETRRVTGAGGLVLIDGQPFRTLSWRLLSDDADGQGAHEWILTGSPAPAEAFLSEAELDALRVLEAYDMSFTKEPDQDVPSWSWRPSRAQSDIPSPTRATFELLNDLWARGLITPTPEACNASENAAYAEQEARPALSLPEMTE